MRLIYIKETILAGCTAILLSACTDSYPGIAYDGDDPIENNEDLKNIPLLLFVNEQDYFYINTSRSLTRGTGAFEQDNQAKYNNAAFHVFAFRDSLSGQSVVGGDVDLCKSAYYPNHASANDKENTSCLLDGTDNKLGMPFKFNPDRAGALELKNPVVIDNKQSSNVYYSNTYQDVGYNFFGYYIDDFQPTTSNTHRTAGEIYYDLHIDGSQDIMMGSAPKITSQLIDEEYSNLKLSKEDRQRIIDIGGYSTFAGHRQLHPVINLEHKLTRLIFKAFPGDESADRVTITGISILARSHGKMVVAGRTADACKLTFNDTREEKLSLREASVDGVTACPALKEEGYVVNWDESLKETPWAERPSTQIGSCLMLPQSDKYTLLLDYTYHGVDGIDRAMTAKYSISAPENDGVSYDSETKKNLFRAGYQYNVKIAVYGLQEIKIAATVDGWIPSSEDIIVDPDTEEFE